jgi:hypothetical protein
MAPNTPVSKPNKSDLPHSKSSPSKMSPVPKPIQGKGFVIRDNKYQSIVAYIDPIGSVNLFEVINYDSRKVGFVGKLSTLKHDLEDIGLVMVGERRDVKGTVDDVVRDSSLKYTQYVFIGLIDEEEVMSEQTIKRGKALADLLRSSVSNGGYEIKVKFDKIADPDASIADIVARKDIALFVKTFFNVNKFTASDLLMERFFPGKRMAEVEEFLKK